ncbi:MAG: hypothetical protein RLY93_08735 [Sumerlaeia bacterium]
MSNRLPLFIAAVILGAIAVALARKGEARAEPPEGPWRVGLAGVLGVLAVFAGLYRWQNGFFLGGDEYARAAYALTWSLDPFFAPHDHVWLTGQFAVLGALRWVLGSVAAAITITSLAGAAATVWLSARLSRRLWSSNAAGVVAGLLAGTHFIVLHASMNPLAEAIFFPLLLASFDQALTGLWCEDRKRKAKAYLRAALFLGLAESFRYEGWFAGMVLGPFLLFEAIRSVRLRKFASAACFLGGAVLLAAFPLAWLGSNWRNLGSPVAFFATGSELNTSMNLYYDMSSPLRKFFAYPEALLRDHGAWLPWAGFGVLLGLLSSEARRRVLPAAIAVGAVGLVAMSVTALSGLGSNNRARYTAFYLMLLLPFAGGVGAVLWERGSRPLRLAVALWLAFLAGSSLLWARWGTSHAHLVDPEVRALCEAMREDEDFARFVQPEGEALGIADGGHSVEFWMLQFYTPAPERVQPEAEGAAAKSRVLIRQGVAVPAGLEPIADFGTYRLYAPAASPPP